MLPDVYDHACTACPLHEGVQTVCVEASGMFPPQYRAMIVGEAPGRSEDAAGRPFVGQAGALLNEILALAFVTTRARQEIVVTNAVKCRPPRNRDPYPKELNTCVDLYLVEEIKQIDPRFILGMGNIALRAMHEVSGITQYRGVWLDLPGREGRTEVLYTFHPAFILYQGRESVAAEQFTDDVHMFAGRCIADGGV